MSEQFTIYGFKGKKKETILRAMRQKLIKARGMGLKGIAIPASIML